MAFVILISLFILNALFFYLEKNLFYALSVIGILMINILIIFLFDRIIEKFRLADEKRQLQKQMDYQDDSYKRTVHSFKSIKQIIHDTNKQLIYIRACIEKNQMQQAIQHITQTLDQINMSYQRVATGNLVIDALVSNALNIAHLNRIDVKYDIRIVAADIRLDRYDLCVVIGNVLDNAIEAARLVPSIEDKFIHLRIYSNDYALTIYVANSRRKLIKEEKQKRKKKDPDFHGFGLTNIQRVAEKYGGHLQTEASSNQFETIVVLPFEG
jgi:sensor histidine kinase regulating citrate/malate metabolism